MKAYELLSSPDKWTQGAEYRDSHGYDCDPEQSVSMCLAGSIRLAYPDELERDTAFSIVRHKVGQLSDWNDAPDRAWDEVLSLLVELDI